MTVYLSIPHIAIDKLVGWSRTADPENHRYRVELADVGQLTVYRSSVWSDRPVLSTSIEEVSLNTSVRQILDRSRWIFGGTGIAALATIAWGATHQPRRGEKVLDEYPVLIIEVTTANGARRRAELAVGKLDEQQLRDQLAQPLNDWADGYVHATIAHLEANPIPINQLGTLYAKIDRMKERDVLSEDQALAINSHASRPYVAEIARRLRSGTVTPIETNRFGDKIAEMHHRGHLSNTQARELRDLLPSTRPSPEVRPPTREQLEAIQSLAELRHTGALTEAEYQAEKARLLNSDR